MAAVEKAVHIVWNVVIPKWKTDMQILQSPPAPYSKPGFKKVSKTLKLTVHIILVTGNVLPNLRQMVCACTTSAKYCMQLHETKPLQVLCSNEPIKVAAIVFQILKFKCLIVSAVSVQSALDPVLAYLLQDMWFKMSPRTLGLPGREQSYGTVNPVHTPLWGSPPLLVLGIRKHLKGSDTHLSVWCSASLGCILCILGCKFPSFLFGHSPFK